MFSVPPVRSTTGCCRLTVTLSGETGRPCTCVCACFQVAVANGAWPGSATVSGPTNSVVSTVGCQTFAVTTMSLALTASGGLFDFNSAPASAQRTSMPNGKPPMLWLAQV